MNDFKQFLLYVKKEARLYTWGFIGSLFRYLIPLSIPLVLKYIFDNLLQNDTLTRNEKIEQLLFIGVALILILILIRLPMEYLRQYCIHKANNNIIKNLRKDAFNKIHSLDAKYFTENKSGEIGTRFFDDIEKIRAYMTALFANIWIEMIVLIFVVGIMFALNIKLTILAIILVGSQFILAHILSKRFKESTRNMMNYRSTLSGFIFEKIQGAYISKLFSSENKDKGELNNHLDMYEVLTDKQARLNATTISAVNVLSDITPFVVVLVASFYVIDGNLTIGSLIAFFAYVDRMKGPVAALVQAFPAIAEGSVALQRIFEFLNEKTNIKEKEQPVQLERFKSLIEFNKVSFSYDKNNDLINDLSFTLEKGKTYAFVGESGGGKSSIIQLLLRLYDVDNGEILIDGVNIKDYSLLNLREHMGIVTQDNFLFSSSIKDNIRMAKLNATDEEIIEAAKKAFADIFIEALPNGYNTEIGERGIKLSGGQKQRLALARVFLKNSSIIILDEATSSLDNESESLVQKSINKIDTDKTIIMVAHRLSTILKADKIFVIKKGQIVESGKHQELLKLNGYYKNLYDNQN